MPQTLNQKTCELIKERIGEVETEKYWIKAVYLKGNEEWQIWTREEIEIEGEDFGTLEDQQDFCSCPSTLPELIEMFKKIELVKGYKEYAVCNPCGAETDAKCQCGMPISVQDWWLYHFLRFCELSAGDWEKAEKYLVSIL